MPVINLLNESAPGKSTDENAANLINLYLVADQDQGKYPAVATYTPGLTVFSATGLSPIRAMFNSHGVIYAVANNKFISVSSTGVVTTIGTLTTSSGFAKIKAINVEILIIDGQNGYMYNESTSTFSQLTSDTYVSNVVMTFPGANYTAATTAVFLDAVGSGAAGTVTQVSGQITGVTLTSVGTGYTVLPPEIIFTTTTGNGAMATVTVVGGAITGIAITAAGSSYSAPSVFIVDPTGTGASATAHVTSGGVTSVTINAGGTGYTAPTIFFYDIGGSGATGTVTTTGPGGSAQTITGLVLTNGGSGYITPQVTIIDPTGTGASATATLTNGVITALNLTAAGTSTYTAPILVITDLAGGGATANAQLTTSTFTNNIQDIVCQDEFGLGIGLNTQTWYASNVSDLKTWPALSFASSTGNQNNLIAISSLRRELWLLGEIATEVWYNAGNPYFTFARRSDVFIEKGCISRDSVVQCDNTLYFLGRSKEGGIEVIRMNGYQPTVISTDPINYQLSTYSVVSDAKGFAYSQEGHTFYVLNFPTANITWVYDITTQSWHERSSNGGRWLADNYIFAYNKQLVGDYSSGNIYQLDMTNYTENSNAITRTLVTHPFYNVGVQVKCSRLQIDFDQTPGATLSNVNLYVSRDGGNTFGLAKPAIPVQTSDGQWRVYWTRLGQARTWVFKITTNMNNKFILLGAWADFTASVT
jgi:hypothetical protein